ncbi:selenocysteine-specific translation elongation factor [Bacillus sp. Marseille-Q1617]|uniref:selenocysteine-specific translation elongation factor n=1 Tax=Bacillus sp. Marseille-Q1617 TaxID=2736887 RepID=UPI00158A721F|nr:selenocysteine-specific translation elongation factor [Bacillus sp. Marseille-Q1617]
MHKRFYTVGMAGHIDHGKTTLTKALTNIDTDRLREEKERQISIELGFAPLYQRDDMQISIIDVPGHERFVRKMIAGVAGIDLVVLVVAADEGIMPQTREHVDILSLLGISNGIVVLTKLSNVDADLRELAKDEVEEELKGSPFEGAPILMVDSVSGEGIPELKDLIIRSIENIPVKSAEGEFRLSIDQVFTLKGQGTIVRGTIYEGTILTGTDVTILPQRIRAKARQIQVHGINTRQGFAGQRTAINLAGVNYQHVERGNVLVSSSHFAVTDTVDVSLNILGGIEHDLKQRMEIKVHTGTSEVMGKLIFFDRNKVEQQEDSILCQIRLNDKIVVKRGDRFIIRRPTPVETLGGGWIINPNGRKYKFGGETITKLRSIEEGTPEERILKLLQKKKSLPVESILKEASINPEELNELLKQQGWIELRASSITHLSIVERCKEMIKDVLCSYHESHPLQKGINKGELQPLLQPFTDVVIQYSIERLLQQKEVTREKGFFRLEGFAPSLPTQWEKRCLQMLHSIRKDGLNVKKMIDYFQEAGIPESLRQSFYHFFIQEKWIVPLDEKYAYAHGVYEKAVEDLKEHTGSTFTVAQAKEILGISRKYMIPFLERLDKEGYTVRMKEERKWISYED